MEMPRFGEIVDRKCEVESWSLGHFGHRPGAIQKKYQIKLRRRRRKVAEALGVGHRKRSKENRRIAGASSVIERPY